MAYEDGLTGGWVQAIPSQSGVTACHFKSTLKGVELSILNSTISRISQANNYKTLTKDCRQLSRNATALLVSAIVLMQQSKVMCQWWTNIDWHTNACNTVNELCNLHCIGLSVTVPHDQATLAMW